MHCTLSLARLWRRECEMLHASCTILFCGPGLCIHDTAWFHFRPVLLAHSSFLNLTGAAFFAASSVLCSMPYTHSSFHGSIWASCTAAKFSLCPMPHADPSFLGYLCASFPAALLLCPRRSVPSTNSSLITKFVHSSAEHLFLVLLLATLLAAFPPSSSSAEDEQRFRFFATTFHMIDSRIPLRRSV